MELEDVKQTFIIEAGEQLQDMESALLRLESDPEDADTINALFRSAHTIKGSAGVVGIETVERFTHKVESLLERVRLGEVKVTSDLVGLLLKCRDHIATLVELASKGEEKVDAELQSVEDSLSKELSGYLEPSARVQAEPQKFGKEIPSGESGVASENWHISLRFGKNVLRDGMDPISFLNYLTRLGEIVIITTIFDAMPPAAEMDPEECYLGFEIDFKSDFDKKTIEDVFEFVREDCRIHILPPHSRIEEYIKLIQALPEDPLNIGDILIKGGTISRSELDEGLRQQRSMSEFCTGKTPEECTVPRIGEILVKEGVVYPEVVEAAVEKQKKVKEIKAQEARTIRVDTGRLDHLINLVGELVISNANISQHAQRIGDGSLGEASFAMSRLVEDIRDTAMKTRMVPIGETFSRFQRVIRDISKDTGKDIELVITGGETELDKTVIEKIGDPLMHLVRNAADHGIEMPDERSRHGKAPKGTIYLSASQEAGSIVIEISDDGKGLSRSRILQKAIDKGMAVPGQSLSDTEVYNFIFAPGFSTAETVTKLSGRGVGMDVVRKNIEALRGTVDLKSEDGIGTAVSIRLPLTLAIIDGFMVGVNGSSYVIPLEMVVECLELSEADKKVERTRQYINLRGKVMPYIRMRDFFGVTEEASGHENVVIVQYAGNRIGLVVDVLFGEIQTVIKSLGKIYSDVKGISGATILGDGTVALILDIPKLVELVERQEGVQD